MDAVSLQVMVGALRAACDEMGVVLVRSAHSANVKERRDASTALFDPDGQMVMQAEHIPVHLGAMPSAVAAVVGEDHSSGDAWVLNDPYRGGTHLPDITVISPVLSGAELVGFAASRAHHADVGGATPGSMPADSRVLDDEGVVIPPTRLARAGRLDEELLHDLTGGMRAPAQRRADLRAQLAANRTGGMRLKELAARSGLGALGEAMRETLDYGERRTRARIAQLPDGDRDARDVLEAGEHDLPLRLTASVGGEGLLLDFTGSADQHDGNLNCPLAVTLSACYFAVRVLTDPDVPPSAGAYRPVRVIAPEGSLLNARPPAAVAAGNVETSSRVADLVLGAFGQALGQGTMNNLTLGNDDFTYYETLAGGQGACADADGPSAVHVAMSNTLNTPIEALELEFPLRAVEYSVRRGSGGAGEHRGGNGVVRELEALGRHALFADHRTPPARTSEPRGGPGERGRNVLNGVELPGKVDGELAPGDRMRIETPGGGGQEVDMAEVERVERVFLGLGIMGARMAANLCRAGFEVTAWNRTRARAEGLAEAHGARGPRHPPRRQATRGDDHDGRGRSAGRGCSSARTARRGPRRGRARADMSTIAPTASRAIADRPRRAPGRLPGRARDRLAPEGRGRHAHRHGRWRASRPSSSLDRCSPPWESSSCTSAAGATVR